MDLNNIDFLAFLETVNKLETVIRNKIQTREFNTILYRKFNIRIENIDKEYNKLLLQKVTENLINEKILKLID